MLSAVEAPDGQPYLSTGSGIFEWTKGTFERRVDLVLRRGVMLRGKVVEEGSGRPVDGAALGYAIRDGASGVPACRARTGPDGRYQFAVLPKAGTLAVMGPSDDYVFQEMGERMLHEGQPGGQRQYAHAFVSCDLKPGTDSTRGQRRAPPRRNRARPGSPHRTDSPSRTRGCSAGCSSSPSPGQRDDTGDRFTATSATAIASCMGLPADAEIPVFFLDSKNQLGATAEFSVKAAADGPITVRLAPCGLAMARLVDSKGNPLAGISRPVLDFDDRDARPRRAQ